MDRQFRSEEAERLKEQGNLAFVKQDYVTSIELYTKAIELFPLNPIYLCNRAGAYSQSCMHEKARADSQAAVGLDPAYAKAWSRLGRAKFDLGDMRGSMEAYDMSIKCEGNGGSDAMKSGYAAAQAILTRDSVIVEESSKGTVQEAASTRKANDYYDPTKYNLDNLLDDFNTDSPPSLDEFTSIFISALASNPSKNSIDQDLIRSMARATVANLKSIPIPDEAASRKTNLSNELMDKFNKTGDIKDLEESILVARESVDLQPESYSTRVKCLYNLSNRLQNRFDQAKKMEDLEEAVYYARQAVDITPSGHEYLGKVLSNLSDKLLVRSQKADKRDDLVESLKLAREAVVATPREDPDFAQRLYSLGGKYEASFNVTGKIEDIDQAISKGNEVIRISTITHSDLIGYIHALSIWLYARFRKTHKLPDLDEAIFQAQKAIEGTSKDNIHLAARLSLLASYFTNRYGEIGREVDLDTSIMYSRKALELCPPTSTVKPSILSTLSNGLDQRYQRNENSKDLEEAICTAKEAMEMTPKGHSDLGGLLSNCGNLLNNRFIRTGNTEDLKNAIIMARESVTLSKSPSLELNNLSSKLLRRYESTGNLEDLEEAISCGEQAIAAASDDEPNLAGWLSNHGTVLIRRYERVGDSKDLEDAIIIIRKALKSSPKNIVKRASMLNSLSFALYYRFMATGNKRDLEEAIQNTRLAVRILPENHPDQPRWLTTLGLLLSSQYIRNGNGQDLEDAIQTVRKALAASPKDHPSCASMLNNLSCYLNQRYDKFGRLEDLDEAIGSIHQAIEATPEGNPGLLVRQINLGKSLATRYIKTKNIEDLEQAIELNRKVVKRSPKDHPDLSKWLNNLGGTLLQRSWQSHRGKDDPDVQEALDSFLRSYHCQNAFPMVRIHSALRAIVHLWNQDDLHQASIISKEAIQLLPLVSSRSLHRDDQQYGMAQVAGLAAQACSIALQAGDDPAEALELLELGRGAVLSNLMDARNNISELRDAFPDIASRFEKLRTELNSPVDTESNSENWLNQSDRRLTCSRELDICLGDIRKCNGFERFLLGPSPTELREIALQGPIIIVNVTQMRSDAIIVTLSTVEAIRLPDITESEIQEWTAQDLTRYASLMERGRKNKKYCQFLHWLWLVCVKPILAKLASSPTKPMHIWWIGVGVASSLPFHAAGDHSAGSTENTFSHAISSYTPTIKALSYARRRIHSSQAYNTASTQSSRPKLLLVAMPKTPGQSDLPGVKREVLEIQATVGPYFSIEIIQQPTAKDVLSTIDKFDIVHFACHGMSDLLDPSKSRLILQNGDKPDSLSVQDILDMNLVQARIIYLSACSTAENKVKELADEAIHLSSAFQMAGFSHVIGSMWPSSDDICVEMARNFYSFLNRKTIDGREDNDMVAEALQDSVLEIRAREPRQSLLWAQYIHIGA